MMGKSFRDIRQHRIREKHAGRGGGGGGGNNNNSGETGGGGGNRFHARPRTAPQENVPEMPPDESGRDYGVIKRTAGSLAAERAQNEQMFEQMAATHSMKYLQEDDLFAGEKSSSSSSSSLLDLDRLALSLMRLTTTERMDMVGCFKFHPPPQQQKQQESVTHATATDFASLITQSIENDEEKKKNTAATSSSSSSSLFAKPIISTVTSAVGGGGADIDDEAELDELLNM